MIKIHIDNIKNSDGRIWGVKSGRDYYRVHDIRSSIELKTKQQNKQPRAFLFGRGTVRLDLIKDRLTAIIEPIK